MSKRSYNIIGTILLFGSLALSACSKPEDRIMGTWTIDLDATMAADEKLKAMPPEQQKMAKEMSQGMLKDTSFEFSKDGKMTANFFGKKEEAQFTVKSADADKVVLSSKDKSGKDQDLTLETKDGKLIMSVGGQKIILSKK